MKKHGRNNVHGYTQEKHNTRAFTSRFLVYDFWKARFFAASDTRMRRGNSDVNHEMSFAHVKHQHHGIAHPHTMLRHVVTLEQRRLQVFHHTNHHDSSK